MEMANITFQDEAGDIKVRIDSEKCITCGRCISACTHDARYYIDDTKRFFDDLSKGVSISLMTAPSIRTNIPEYKRLFTYLKQLGVNVIFDVSRGADICVWAHVRYLEKTGFSPIITQPCPVIVMYCERYHHDLLKWLSPVHSPMACASIYMKEYLGITDRIAAISPCIAKSNEFEATGLAQYNITYYKLLEYMWEHDIVLPSEETQFDHDESGLGFLFPIPGGLKENVEYAIGRSLFIAQSEGYSVYEKLSKFAELPVESLPDIFDVLNCIEGCNVGTACLHDHDVFEIGKTMNDSRKKRSEKLQRTSYEAMYKSYDETLDHKHFLREYTPVSITLPQITDAAIEEAFELLGRTDYRTQSIDCSACGSETCYDMARKIALKVNIPLNCMVKAMEDAKTEHVNYIIAHEQLLEAVDIAKEASQAKTAFLANMSHEIRTPMNSIMGMAELLEHEQLNDRQMRFVKDISASAQSLLGIINDILDMSKIEAGKLELNPVDYSLRQLADNAASMFTYIASNKGLEFTVETADDLPDCLYGDDVRLRQILTNICGNAIKFTERGFVKLTITTNDGMLLFKVEDSGMGIRNEDLPKLFKIFEQVDKAKNRNLMGTGLGLSISRSFVKMMGGEITVESEYGQGTVFTIVIPIVKGNEENVRKEKMDSVEQLLSAPEARVLVTDDNELNLKVASGLLSLMDINAETANSGLKAINLIKRNDYDIVFMDHMMPDMDGIETLHEIRKLGGKYKDLIIVALTANAVKSAREMLLSNGFNDFLAKPIDSIVLGDILRKYLPPDRILSKTSRRGVVTQAGITDELRRNAIITFVKENRGTFWTMLDALDSEDFKTAHRIAHTLKSSAGYLGKIELQEAALALELSLQSEPPVYTAYQLDIFNTELARVLIEFDPVFKESEAEKTAAVQIDIEELSALLMEIRPLLHKGDFTVVSYIKQLQGIIGMEELSELIEDYDFENALKLLDEIAAGRETAGSE